MSNQVDNIVTAASREIEAMIERLEELQEWAADWGLRGMENKIVEAIGPLSSAAGAGHDFVGRDA